MVDDYVDKEEEEATTTTGEVLVFDKEEVDGLVLLL